MDDETVSAINQLPEIIINYYQSFLGKGLPEELVQTLTISFQEQILEEFMATAYWDYSSNGERETDIHAAAVLAEE